MFSFEPMLAQIGWADEEHGYAVIALLYRYYIPVKCHNPSTAGSTGVVLEAFWTDDVSHIVAFHSLNEALNFIEFAKSGNIDEYLPSETYAKYRAWEKKEQLKHEHE